MTSEQVDHLIGAFQDIALGLKDLNDILAARTVGKDGETVTAALFEIAEALGGIAHAVEEK